MEKIEAPWFEKGLRFKCTGCGQCCTGTPGYVFLSTSDLDRLAKRFELTPHQFAQKYTRKVDEQYALLDRPSTYDCIFLDEKRCSVYEDRPVQCRTFPWWVHHLRDPQDWQAAKERCEGIEHPEAPLIESQEIEQQCLTYLDNLLDHHFSL